MRISLPRLRLLPATIVAMSLLLLVKTATFASDTLGGSAAAATSSPEVSQATGQAAGPAPAPAPGAPAGSSSPAAVSPSAAPMPPAPPADSEPLAAAPEVISSVERALLLDLRKRRQALDDRAAALDAREQVQAAAEAKLAARVGELSALQVRLESLEAAREQHASENWNGLVRVYETMKPRDAAVIFDALDMQVLLQVLDRMQDRRAAPILAAMQPDRARLATQLLAEMRLRATTLPGQAAAVHSPDSHS